MSKDLDIFPEIKALTLNNSFNSLVAHSPEHTGMLVTIQESLPEIHRATSLFCKTQSQFMDNMLTVSHTTPLRNIRQILAEMNKTREAIKESHFKLLKKEVELKMKQRDFNSESDELKKEMIQIEILELMSGIESTNGHISGAIRKLTNYVEQYKSLIKVHGLENFNELDFEKAEERHHIMKAFEQGTIAARSNGGRIDEGNMIYLTQIGINGAVAQKDVSEYLAIERELLSEGKEPTHKMFLMFLERMANKFHNSAKKYAEYKGLTSEITETATLKHGDMRLLK